MAVCKPHSAPSRAPRPLDQLSTLVDAPPLAPRATVRLGASLHACRLRHGGPRRAADSAHARAGPPARARAAHRKCQGGCLPAGAQRGWALGPAYMLWGAGRAPRRWAALGPAAVQAPHVCSPHRYACPLGRLLEGVWFAPLASPLCCIPPRCLASSPCRWKPCWASSAREQRACRRRPPRRRGSSQDRGRT